MQRFRFRFHAVCTSILHRWTAAAVVKRRPGRHGAPTGRRTRQHVKNIDLSVLRSPRVGNTGHPPAHGRSHSVHGSSRDLAAGARSVLRGNRRGSRDENQNARHRPTRPGHDDHDAYDAYDVIASRASYGPRFFGDRRQLLSIVVQPKLPPPRACGAARGRTYVHAAALYTGENATRPLRVYKRNATQRNDCNAAI